MTQMPGRRSLKSCPAMLQGHSKNASSDEGDGVGAVFAEVFARLAHGQAAGSDEVQDEIAQRGEWAGAGAPDTRCRR